MRREMLVVSSSQKRPIAVASLVAVLTMIVMDCSALSAQLSSHSLPRSLSMPMDLQPLPFSRLKALCLALVKQAPEVLPMLTVAVV